MRWFSITVLLAYLGVLFTPAIIVTDFLIERDHIARELCVQRLVPEQVRTCHGQCYLMRTLNKVEQREKDLPGELRSFRLDDVTLPMAKGPGPVVLPSVPFVTAVGQADPLDGFGRPSDPVPWC